MLINICHSPKEGFGDTQRWVCNVPQAMYQLSYTFTCLFMLHMS